MTLKLTCSELFRLARFMEEVTLSAQKNMVNPCATGSWQIEIGKASGLRLAWDVDTGLIIDNWDGD